MNKDICFVILHYGDIDVTKKCIDSLMLLDSHKDYKIVLIDNDTHKSDEERNKLDLLFNDNKQINIIRILEKAGFSRANNIGYKYVLDNYNPKYIVVCNNDIEFKQIDFFNIVDDIYKETNFAVLGPDVIRASDKIHQNPHTTSLVTKEQAIKSIKNNTFFLKHYDFLYPVLYLYWKWQDYNEKRISDKNLDNHTVRRDDVVLVGSILIFSKNYFEVRDKCFYPETEFYCEEQILAYECKKLELKQIYDPCIYVYHESEASTRNVYSNQKKKLKFRLKNSIDSLKVYLELLESERKN